MFHVFLSHNSQDKAAVELLAHRLQQEVRLEPFLDKWHLVPGQSWQPDLERALEQSASVAIFFGPSGISPWHNEELRVALSHAVRTRDEYRVIPVLLPGSRQEDVKGFLAQRMWVDFRSGLDDVDAFERLVAGIKGHAPKADTYRLPDDPAPYRGLLPFGKAHARFFFGREPEIQTVLGKLQQYPFVAVVGASGVGKSSLVLAGVLPRLEGSGQQPYLKTMTPGDRPLRALANQLATLVPATDRLRTAEDLVQLLASRPEALRDAVATLTADQPGPLLLVVDQLEELFTYAPREGSPKETDAFVSTLRDAVEKSRGAIRVLTTLRADFYVQALAVPALRALLQDHQVLLGNLGVEGLRDAIVRPAQAVGAFLEKGLVGTLLKDVDVSQAPAALPLLEHALYELWRARDGAWLTLSAYEASGGVSGALQRRAQSTYEALGPEEQEIARGLFLRLTSLGEGTPDTRRRVARSELTFADVPAERVEHVLQVLSGPEARLLVANGDTVEVAHEVLIREWPTLRGWLDKNRRQLKVHRRLTEAANEWAEHGGALDYLYTGSRLMEAEERFASTPEALNQRESDFLTASLAHRDAQRERERQELLQAQRERDQARSRELTARALLLLKKAPQESLHLIQEAWRSAPTPEIEEALSAWRFEPGIAVLSGHEAPVFAASYSPDGSRLVTGSADGTARLWESASSKLLAVLEGHFGEVTDARFSPDGSRLFTTSKDGTARLWDAASGQPLARLTGHSSLVVMAEFDVHGSRLVTASQDGTARVWNVATGESLLTLAGHGHLVSSASYSPDGSRLVTASYDATARVWEAASGRTLVTLSGHTEWVVAAVFSPDGASIATASQDFTARLWDAASGKCLVTLSGHSSAVRTVTFSPEGSWLVTGSKDGTARLWSCWLWAPLEVRIAQATQLQAGRPINETSRSAPWM